MKLLKTPLWNLEGGEPVDVDHHVVRIKLYKDEVVAEFTISELCSFLALRICIVCGYNLRSGMNWHRSNGTLRNVCILSKSRSQTTFTLQRFPIATLPPLLMLIVGDGNGG